MNKNLYNILGVDKSCSSADIKKAYRKKALQYHPDRNLNDKKSEEKFKEINEANSILSDGEKRSAYDKFGYNGVNKNYNQSSNPFNMEDIFKNMSGTFNNFEFHPNPSQGENSRLNLNITFEEAIFGCQKILKIKRNKRCTKCDGEKCEKDSSLIQCSHCNGSGNIPINFSDFLINQKCPHCDGKGVIYTNPCTGCSGTGEEYVDKKININIPAGVNENTKLKVQNEGKLNINSNISGDLYIFISISPHKYFVRNNYDLYYSKEISFSQAALGDKIKIPTVNNEGYILTVPQGTQSGTTFNLQNKGVKFINKSLFGNLYVKIIVRTPVKLTPKEKKLFSNLLKEEKKSQK